MQYKQQVNSKDCGIFVIQNLVKFFYDYEPSITHIKAISKYSLEGITIKMMIQMLGEFGIKSNAFKGNFESFKNIKIINPIITLIKNDISYHYVIVKKITTSKNIIYIDPIFGKMKVSLEEFEKIYSGIIIVNEKNKKLEEKNKTKKIDVFKVELNYKIIVPSVSTIIVFLISIISSFYIKLILDTIVPTSNLKSFLIISSLFVLIMIFQTLLNILNQKIISLFEIKIHQKNIYLYFEKLKNINWEKISHLDNSDHFKNLELISKISTFKANYVFNLTSQIFSLAISSLFLIILSPKIFVISSILSFALCFISFSFKNKFKTNENEMILKTKKYKEHSFDIINNLIQFKLSQDNSIALKNLSNSLNDVFDISKKIINCSLFYNFIQSIIKNSIPFIIMSYSIFELWNNKITVGQIFLILSLLNFYITPLFSLSSLFVEIPIIKNYVDSINSFYSIRDYKKIGKLEINKIKEIKIERLKFNFDGSNDVLNLNNLVIKNHIKILGKNSSGKSTLLKILSTLILWEDTLINECNIMNYDLNKLRQKIYLVNSNEYLFGENIFQYLEVDNLEYLNKNIKDFELNKFMEELNISLHTKILNGGENLSSGQKQFISILKVFAKDYSLILFDESFENIDKYIVDKLIKILKIYLNNKIVVEVSHRNNFIFEEGEAINLDIVKK